MVAGYMEISSLDLPGAKWSKTTAWADKLEVPITAAAVKCQVTQHRLRQGSRRGHQTRSDSNTPQPQTYSEEAFVDALVEWIVADDQVSFELIVCASELKLV